MRADGEALERRLAAMVRSSPALMELLDTARRLELASWCIGAGAVRSMVWDRLHGFAAPTRYDDVDVVYYDGDAAPAQDAALLERLRSLQPGVCWEVTNQATVHHWFLDQGAQVAPLGSLAEGIATWPEYATCVGVSLGSGGEINVIAPHGLDDLFQLRVRHNPVRASAAVFTERVSTKRFTERWPMLTIFPG